MRKIKFYRDGEHYFYAVVSDAILIEVTIYDSYLTTISTKQNATLVKAIRNDYLEILKSEFMKAYFTAQKLFNSKMMNL